MHSRTAIIIRVKRKHEIKLMVLGYSGNARDQISYHSSLPMPKSMTVAVLIVQLHSKGVANIKAAIVLILRVNI